MITTSHIIYGWATAKATEARPNKKRTLAFVIGSFLPDIPVYTFFVVHGIILRTSHQTMWNELYFNSTWTPIFTLSHSLLLWPAVLLLGTILKQKLLQYIGSAAVIHVCADFLVHNDDAYAHFWPLSEWKFISPVSYWDPDHYGRIIGAIDTIVILGLLTWLYSKCTGRRARIGIGVIVLLYIVSLVLPFFIF